jgi:hypothetical protein
MIIKRYKNMVAEMNSSGSKTFLTKAAGADNGN